jgi:hypothetical protein
MCLAVMFFVVRTSFFRLTLFFFHGEAVLSFGRKLPSDGYVSQNMWSGLSRARAEQCMLCIKEKVAFYLSECPTLPALCPCR